MNTFDFLRNILNKGESLKVKTGDDFSPYMIQRWLSMVSPELCFVVNETTNTFWKALENNSEWNDAFISFIPKIGFKKINYIKKEKAEPREDVSILARQMEMSYREVEELVEIDPSLLDLKKDVEYKRRVS